MAYCVKHSLNRGTDEQSRPRRPAGRPRTEARSATAAKAWTGRTARRPEARTTATAEVIDRLLKGACARPRGLSITHVASSFLGDLLSLQKDRLRFGTHIPPNELRLADTHESHRTTPWHTVHLRNKAHGNLNSHQKGFRRRIGEAASPHKKAGSGNAGRPDRLDHQILEER